MRPAIQTWKEVAVTAFWDREVPFEKWQAGFLAGSISYLPQTVSFIEPRSVIALLPPGEFIAKWPDLRLIVASRFPELRRKLPRWDGHWSMAATGTMDIKPLPEWFILPRRAKEFLLWVAKHPGTSIYAAGKGLKMTYKRAFEHASRLGDLGFLKKRMDETGPRKIQRLYAFS
jgi:hypothetical protein